MEGEWGGQCFRKGTDSWSHTFQAPRLPRSSPCRLWKNPQTHRWLRSVAENREKFPANTKGDVKCLAKARQRLLQGYPHPLHLDQVPKLQVHVTPWQRAGTREPGGQAGSGRGLSRAEPNSLGILGSMALWLPRHRVWGGGEG